MNNGSTHDPRLRPGWFAVLGLTVAISSVGDASGQTADLDAKATTATKADAQVADNVNLASFDKVWEIVRDNHWEEDFGGVDWDQARKDLRPKVAAAKTTAEARKVLQELIGRLKVSHFGIIPSDAYSTINEGTDAATGTGGEAGFTVRLRNNLVTIASVTPGSSADKAGVKPGWTIHQVAGKTHDELLESATKASSTGPDRLDTTVGLLGERLNRGAPGKTRTIEFKDYEGNIQSIDIVMEKADGTMAKFGHLPKMRVDYETRQLPEDVTYFSFNLFFDPPNVMPAFRAAVEQARESKGLVIDLRGNHGGIAGMTFGMASAFATEAGKMGVMKMRTQEMTFPLFPPLEPYTGPVAVLIDECSISSAEIMSGGMQDKQLARLFGTTTAGLALPSTVVELPNGDRLQYAFATYTSASGKVLEGVGVVPDEQIAPGQQQLKENPDPVLSRAVEWITEQDSTKP
ncbi:MAG: S41 family peptidase [Planctomycetaceae bacterium]|nr:S41 family peptidase [Planctomycetaceae bacterium]